MKSERWAACGLLVLLILLPLTCGVVSELRGQEAASTITGPTSTPAGEAATYTESRESESGYQWSVSPDAPLKPNDATAQFLPQKPGDYTLTCQGTESQTFGWFGRRHRLVPWSDSLAVKVTDPRPLGKWQVSYPASTQTIKAVTADDAVTASVPPAPEAKALSAAKTHHAARAPPGKRQLGLKPTPAGKLQAALKAGEPLMAKLRALPAPPKNFDGSGGVRDFTMGGNDVYGTCVSAEEQAAKRVISAKTGAPKVVIPDANLIAWARKHGYLNGAMLDEVLDTMTRDGLRDAAGVEHRDDDTAVAIDGTKKLITQLAIYYTGQIKVAITASPVMNADDGEYGWILLSARGGPLDHCVGYCGYGSLEFCCQTLGVKVPAGADPKRFCLIMYTWSRLGIVSWEAAQSITGEWWMRGTDPDRLDAVAWRERYKTAMDDITGGVVVPPNTATWSVSYPAQAAVVVDARDAADAISRVPYKGKPTATQIEPPKATKVIEVPASAEIAAPPSPSPACPAGNCGQVGPRIRRH